MYNSISPKYTPRSGIAGSHKSIFYILRNWFFTVASAFYVSPEIYESFSFSKSSPAFVVGYCPSVGWTIQWVLSGISLWYFSNDRLCGTSFHVLISHLSSLEKCQRRSFVFTHLHFILFVES